MGEADRPSRDDRAVDVEIAHHHAVVGERLPELLLGASVELPEGIPRFIGAAMQGVGNELQKHANEQAEKNEARAERDAAAKG